MNLTNIDWWKTGELIAGITAALLVALLIGAIAKYLMTRAKHRAKPKGRTVETVLTVVVAIIVTGVSAQGMWNFFGDVLGVENPIERIALFSFMELAMTISAIRARRNLLDDLAREEANPTTGLDGKAVWVIATLSGVLSALDAASFGEVFIRLIAPLVAAWLWERGLAAHRRAAGRTARINLRFTPERILVALGLADVSDRTAADVERARRMRRLTEAAYKRHLCQVTAGDEKAMMSARTKLLRRILQATGQMDADDLLRVRTDFAAVVQAEAELTAEAVADLSPWKPVIEVPPAPIPVPNRPADGSQLARPIQRPAANRSNSKRTQPTKQVRRSKEETRTLADDYWAKHPDANREEVAAALRIDARSLRRALNEPSGAQPVVPAPNRPHNGVRPEFVDAQS